MGSVDTRVGWLSTQSGQKRYQIDQFGFGERVQQALGHQRVAWLFLLYRFGVDLNFFSVRKPKSDRLIVTTDHNSVDHFTVVGQNAERRVAFLQLRTGSEQRLENVIGLRAATDADQVGTDETASVADRVTLDALQFLSAINRFAARRRSFRCSGSQDFVAEFGRQFPRGIFEFAGVTNRLFERFVATTGTYCSQQSPRQVSGQLRAFASSRRAALGILFD